MTPEMEKLINLYLLDAGSMTQEQTKQLSAWILEDPEHMQSFVGASMFHRSIHDYLLAQDPAQQLIVEDDGARFVNGALTSELEQLLAMEQAAPLVPREERTEDDTDTVKTEPDKSAAPPSAKPWLWVLRVSAAAALILIVVSLINAFRPAPVATIIDLYGVQGFGPGHPLQVGTRLFDKSAPLQLPQGVMKLSFDNETQVVLEGPLEFRIKSDECLTLMSGRACVKVPPDMTGFRINTPHIGIVDLGTEFGVHVDATGQANVQMYDGKASLVDPNADQPDTEKTISKGQARTVDTEGHIRSAPMEPHSFVRQFSSKTGIFWRGEHIDLADIVGGGNGLGSGKHHWGIDPNTGRLQSSLPEPSSNASGFTEVPGSPFIDGVFVPNGIDGPIGISSKHHRFADCPRTSGTVKGGIFNGGAADDPRYGNSDAQGRPLIVMHSNQGVTFDLNMLRALYQSLHSDIRIARFRARAGINPMALDVMQQDQFEGMPNADVWILIDGEKRFEARQLTPAMSPTQLDIPIQAHDKFLTLVVTDGSNRDMSYDWVLLTNPILELAY